MSVGNNIPRLPDGELKMMQAVWALEPPVSRSDLENTNAGRKLAPTTILTLLTRLTERGFLRVEKEGRQNLYYPIITRREYLASQSSSFLQKLCGGDLSLFATALTDSGITGEELEELREYLKKEGL